MKILLIDDHPLFCDGLKGILAGLSSEVNTLTAGSCEEAVDIIQNQEDMDLVLLDLNLPGINGLDGIQKIRFHLPATPIVILSASDDRDKVLRAIEKGAKGYIPKSSGSDIIINALRLVLSGGVYLPMAALDSVYTSHTASTGTEGQALTPKQQAVLELLAEGHSNKTIGNTLNMAENTVRVHVSAILRLLGVSNRTEAGMVALRMGMLMNEKIN